MKQSSSRTRILREEHGFTLTEVLVTVMIMVIVLFALYNIFDTSIRIFSYSNQRVEAIQNARASMERMAREIRMAYPKNNTGTNNNPTVFNTENNALTGSSNPVGESGYYTDNTRITFGNDINGDYEIGRVGGNPSESPNNLDEVIVYWASGGQLRRCYRCDAQQYDNPNPSPPLANFGPAGNLEFEYYAENTEISAENYSDISTSEERTIDRVRIVVTIDTGRPGDPNTQTLTTDVALRNRSL